MRDAQWKYMLTRSLDLALVATGLVLIGWPLHQAAVHQSQPELWVLAVTTGIMAAFAFVFTLMTSAYGFRHLMPSGTEAQAWIIAVAAAAGVGVLWAYLQHPHEALSATDFATAFILTISAVRYIALPAFMEAVSRKAK